MRKNHRKEKTGIATGLNVGLKHICDVCGFGKMTLPITGMTQVNVQPAGTMWVDRRHTVANESLVKSHRSKPI